MTKFNVGDRVRVFNHWYSLSDNQREGTIVGEGYTDYRVKLDNYGIHTEGVLSFSEHQMSRIYDVSTATDRRLTEAEAKIAALEAEVATLNKAMKKTLGIRSPSEYFYPNNPVTTNITINADSQSFDSHVFARKVADALGVTRKPEKTPNQRRADVIKRAQAFVAEHTKYNTEAEGGKGVSIRPYYVARPEFHVNKEKRAVTVLFKGVGTKQAVRAKAVAKCAPDDVFNADIGKAIALGRALGVKVPKEFTDAVKPTEVVVGMVVKSNREWPRATLGPFYIGDVFTVISRELNNDKYTCHPASSIAETSEIIDDTNAVYS